MNTHVVILAAGKGTRMKSARPKVLHRVAGQPLIARVLATAAVLDPTTTTVVIGHQSETLTEALAGYRGLTFVVQEPQLGTGHALMTSEAALAGQTGTLILLSGDVPLLTAATLKTLVDHHRTTCASATVVMSARPRRRSLPWGMPLENQPITVRALWSFHLSICGAVSILAR